MLHMLQTVAVLARSKAAVLGLPAPARLLSTAAPTLAATLEQQLREAPWLQLLPVPGAGRGLFAAQPLEQGMVVHMEAPMLCAPSPHALDCTCHQCLKPLAGGSPAAPAGASAAAAAATAAAAQPAASSGLPRFCSSHCGGQAQQAWAQVAARCDFRPLQQACRESGEKFPLMMVQLACLIIQQQQQGQQGQQQAESSANCSSSAPGDPAADRLPSHGDPLTGLRHLCYANIAAPPEPWVHMHSLLLQGLLPLYSSDGGSSDGGSSDGGSSDGGSSGSGGIDERWLRDRLSLEWFCDGMARLHLNSFRVDTVPPLGAADPAALLRAAAASLAGTAAPAHHTGSAVYLLASMFNHSCEPNLDISFPENNATVAFTAARDIAAHEQLTISYIDAEQGVAQRRQALQFGYGFTCRCPRCQEEATGHGQ